MEHTADGVLVTRGMNLFRLDVLVGMQKYEVGDREIYDSLPGKVLTPPSEMYSTQAAADAAREE